MFSPLISTAANLDIPPWAALCPSHPTPCTQTRGTPCWGHYRDIVTSSHPWLGSVPVLFPFSVSPKASGGFQALEFCSAKVLLRAGNVWGLNECSMMSVGSWAWVQPRWGGSGGAMQPRLENLTLYQRFLLLI